MTGIVIRTGSDRNEGMRWDGEHDELLFTWMFTGMLSKYSRSVTFTSRLIQIAFSTTKSSNLSNRTAAKYT